MRDSSSCSARSGKDKRNRGESTLYSCSMWRRSWTCSWPKRKIWTGGTRNTSTRSKITRNNSIGYCLSYYKRRTNWQRQRCNTKKCWKRRSSDLNRFWAIAQDSISYMDPSYFISCQIRKTIRHQSYTQRIPANTSETRKAWPPSSISRRTKVLWLWKWVNTDMSSLNPMSIKGLCT